MGGVQSRRRRARCGEVWSGKRRGLPCAVLDMIPSTSTEENVTPSRSAEGHDGADRNSAGYLHRGRRAQTASRWPPW
eukprot:3226932-Pyramimonas_sp.AAC.1